MADWYVDDTNGDDTTGMGTDALPWQTIQKAVDSAGGGDTIYLANTSAFVLSSSITWGSFGSTAIDSPLIIRPWDNGGSVSITDPGGTTRVAAEIDGNDAVSSIFSSSGQPNYVILIGLKIHSTTSNLFSRLTGWSMYFCECWDASGAAIVASGSYIGQHTIGCIVRDSGGTGVNGLEIGQGLHFGNYISNVTGHGIRISQVYATVLGNVVDQFMEDGINAASNKDGCAITFNTVNDGSNIDANGINVGTTNSEMMLVAYNLITNMDGASNKGLEIQSGSRVDMIGPNAFYNCTTETVDNSGNTSWDRSAEDVSLASDPFENEAGADFDIDTGSAAFAAVEMMMSGASGYQWSYGALQKVAAGGGGGGGTTSYVSVG